MPIRSGPAHPTGAGIVQLAEELRAGGARIVLTNGCFDVLHRGHVEYLEEAAGWGDVLVVAVNDDEGVRALKGPRRPINPLPDRMAVLRALRCVDHVVSFSEPTPARVIKALRPDVFVKGGDYQDQQLEEAPLVESLGGEVRIARHVPGRSTSLTLRRGHLH